MMSLCEIILIYKTGQIAVISDKIVLDSNIFSINILKDIN